MVCWDVEKTGVCPRTSSGRSCKWCDGAPDEDWKSKGAKPKAQATSRSIAGNVTGVRQTQFQKPAIGASPRQAAEQQPQGNSMRTGPQPHKVLQLQQQHRQQQQQWQQQTWIQPWWGPEPQGQTWGTNLRPQRLRSKKAAPGQAAVVCDDMKRLGTCPRGDECVFCKAMFESCDAIDFGESTAIDYHKIGGELS